ncbi:DUF4355 domain-containing protein [Lactobacillus sp. LC28-10]|uniref:DUF4355 domain-containing protein n=1 Tax=Secundilactobacillus angelensis TaxID=2722706 RepID=A0ABX1L1V6_9LACO|nr:DUF4355 domain-containing protein [Secundilactobacillus angelensis]MCH5463206.1 DUF4355 domain-containing protein [Secundilactobacillus angelensis]NLR19435.1 DUF4355 domain-containing protein [Secundilactobacillus angelensis]
MKLLKLYSLDLQRFADGDDGDSGDTTAATASETTETDATETTDGNTENPDAITFKDQSELDSWYDKKFSKSASKLKETWTQEQNQQKAYEDMSPAEKREFDDNKHEKELAAREQKLVIGENRANISEKLANDGLPVSLVKAFEPALSNSESLDDVYKAITESYRSAVQTGVDKKLASSANVPGTAGSQVKSSLGKQLATERNNENKPADNNIWATK